MKLLKYPSLPALMGGFKKAIIIEVARCPASFGGSEVCISMRGVPGGRFWGPFPQARAASGSPNFVRDSNKDQEVDDV